jgi:hypothetical protein
MKKYLCTRAEFFSSIETWEVDNMSFKSMIVGPYQVFIDRLSDRYLLLVAGNIKNRIFTSTVIDDYSHLEIAERNAELFCQNLQIFLDEGFFITNTGFKHFDGRDVYFSQAIENNPDSLHRLLNNR